MLTAHLIRKYHDSHTQGVLVITFDGRIVFTCSTVELPNRNNERRKSCIPEGTYKVVAHFSSEFKDCYLVQNVKERSLILIHAGNTTVDTLGCILPGVFQKSGKVVQSRNTMKRLLTTVPDGFMLRILSEDLQERGTELDAILRAVAPILLKLLPTVVDLIGRLFARKTKRNLQAAICQIFNAELSDSEKIELVKAIIQT